MGAKEPIFTPTAAAEVAVADWTRLLVGCRREQYCASLLARAVEDCDAHLLNLNVYTPGAITGDAAASEIESVDSEYPVRVELRVNHRNAEYVGRSLERYGFTVLHSQSSSDTDQASSSSRNYDNLMRYLEF